MISVILFLSISSSLASIDWNYDTVKKTGKFCPEKDSCQFGRSSRQSLELDWRRRNCLCDSLCAEYGDCCIDSKYFQPDQQRQNYGRFSCKQFRQYGQLYIRDKCPADWTEVEVRNGCEKNILTSDPIGSLPVTSPTSGITYKNFQCAVCNGDSQLDLQFWQPRLECPTLQGYNARFGNISKEFLLENLKFNKGQWGVEFDTIGVPVMHACYFDPFLPPALESLTRHCHGDQVEDSCPEDYQDLQTHTLCNSYTGLIYRTDGTVYKNTHCAKCNNVTADSLICIKLEARMLPKGSLLTPGFKPHSFAVLFDINFSSGSLVGGVSLCEGEGVIWDPFARKCRNVVCGLEGQTFLQGKCYNKGEEPELTTSTSTTTTTTTSTSTSTSTTTTSTTVPTTTTRITTSITTDSTTVEESEATARVTSTSERGRYPAIVFPTEETFSINSPVLTSETTQTTTTSTTTTTTTATTTPITTTTTSPIPTQTSTSAPPPTSKRPVSTSTTSLNRQPALPTINQPNNSSQLNLNTCNKIPLQPEEFEMQENFAIYVSAYNKTYYAEEFWLEDSGTAVVCRPAWNEVDFEPKFSPIMGYVTCACLGVSLVCLVVHVTVSIIAPELHNLSGKNLLSLSIALIGFYSTFMLNMFIVEISTVSCLILAVAMYYFILAAFSWMFIIGFDVARTVKLASTQLRLSTGAQWGKFLLFCLAGWVMPACIVATATVIDVMKFEEIPEKMRPGFAESDVGLCWFSQKFSLIIFFFVPFAVIMFLNLVFFLMSAYFVWETTKSSAKITTSGPKSNFFLYARLSTLMGLTWITGILAAVLDIEEVWYIFLVLNTLQGLFILVFFSCSKKVMSSVKERLFPDSQEDTLSTWQWTGGPKYKDQLDLRDSQDSTLSGRSSSYLTTSNSRPFKYSATSYDQYHKYDQRYYNYNNYN